MEVIRGYLMGVVEPNVMRGLQPAGATRVTLDVIIPSPTGLTPESGSGMHGIANDWVTDRFTLNLRREWAQCTVWPQ